MSKITASARGEDCQIRVPGICNRDPATVVACHIPGQIMGGKANDMHSAYGCSSCHDYVDGRAGVSHLPDNNAERMQLKLWLLEAVIRTQVIYIEKGLIGPGIEAPENSELARLLETCRYIFLSGIERDETLIKLQNDIEAAIGPDTNNGMPP